MRGTAWMLGMAVGCAPEPAETLSDGAEEPAARAEPMSVPIYGGGLAASGVLVVATAPSHDAVVFVDAGPGEARVLGTTALGQGAVPGRVAIAGNGVFVVLRGSGEIARLDASTRALVDVQPVCDEPRDLHVDGDDLWVTCAGGWLVRLDLDLQEHQRAFVKRDLREVLVHEGALWVSQFHSASLFELEPDTLEVMRRIVPDLGDQRVARSGTRLRSSPHGVLLLHSSATSRPLDLAESLELPPEDDAQPPPTAYGAAGTLCEGGTHQAHLTLAFPWPDSDVVPSAVTHSIAGPLVPVDMHQDRLADAGSLGHWNANVGDLRDAGCSTPTPPQARGEGPTTAVLWTSAHWVTVQEAPFEIRIDDAPLDLGRDGPGALPTDPAVRDFHLDAGAGVSCASCHPEGQQDGHTWEFMGLGSRRTQSVAGDVLDRAPYHWDGEFGDLDGLLEEVHERRMGGSALGPMEVDALGEWMHALRPVRHAPRFGDVAQGEALFRSAACDTCHGGPAWTNNELVDVGTAGLFKVPSLLGVGARGPWMHNGCANTLRARFDSVSCGGATHGDTSDLTGKQITDLIAFLEVL